MKKIEAVVFDFGGVLIDWNPRYLYDKVFKTPQETEYFLQNICTSEWNWLMDKGKPFELSVKELQSQHPEYSEQIEMFDKRWEEMIGKVNEDTVSILKEVSAKLPVYGLTNWSGEKFKIVRPKYDFMNIFDGIVVSGIEKQAKPEEPLFHILLQRYGLKAESTFFTDDSELNIATATRLGFRTHRFVSARALRLELEKNGVL